MTASSTALLQRGCKFNESCRTYKWVMPHVWMSLVTIMSQPWMRALPFSSGCNRNESCCIHEWVMSHVCISHITHTMNIRQPWTRAQINESCHTYEWVMSHIPWTWASPGWEQAPHFSSGCNRNKSCRTYKWVMSHVCMSHITRTINMNVRMSHVTHTRNMGLPWMRVCTALLDQVQQK